jgi:hypothetical protein
MFAVPAVATHRLPEDLLTQRSGGLTRPSPEIKPPQEVCDRDIFRHSPPTSGKLHALFLLFLLERPQKRKINVRKNLPSRFANNIYT